MIQTKLFPRMVAGAEKGLLVDYHPEPEGRKAIQFDVAGHVVEVVYDKWWEAETVRLVGKAEVYQPL